MMYGIIKFSKENKNYSSDDLLSSGYRIKDILLFSSFNAAIILILISVSGLFMLSIISLSMFLYSNAFIIFYCIIMIPVFRRIGAYFEIMFDNVKDNIQSLVDGKQNLHHQLEIDEFIFLEKFIRKMFNEQKVQEKLNFDYQIKQQELETIALEQNKFRKSIGQLVHDMNSPLETINGTLRLLSHQIPEDSRRIIANSTRRLSGLAYGVLNQYKNVDSKSNKALPLLVALSIDEVFNEKITEYHALNIKFLLDIDTNSYNSFIMIDNENLKRMLSNLINNAVDAVKIKDNARISLKLKQLGENIIIFIEDNGCGMPKHIIEKFLQGDSETAKKISGHGIGLIQVFEAIQSGNGEVSVHALDGIGTEIMIRFPLCEKPWWFCQEIELLPDSIIVIVDDEPKIHSMWDEKLKDILTLNTNILINHFTDGLQTINYINGLSTSQKNRVYLFTDYNLEGQNINGLNIINQVIIDRALIISSYDNLENNLSRYVNKVKLLPKILFYKNIIQIKIVAKRDYANADMIWLDDHQDFVEVIIKENYSHLKIERYNNPEDLLKDIEKYKKKDVRIVLDNHYEIGNGVLYHETGIDIAKKLHEIGYTNLVLLTGDVMMEGKDKIPDYIRVVSKDNMAMLKLLYDFKE